MAKILRTYVDHLKNYLFQVVWALLVSVQATWCYAEDVSGAGFTDPSRIWHKMAPGWTEQTVTPAPAALKTGLAITLDQQLHAPLLPWIQKFAAQRKLKIAVSKGTCGISAGLLSRKAVDMGGFCCPPALTDRLPNLRFHTLAIAAIALIVHPDAPVDNLTLEQARAVFQGKISKWSAIDNSITLNKKSPINVIGRLHCKLRPGHWRLLLDNEDLFGPDLLEVGTIQDMITSVASDPLAVGYETLWMVQEYGKGRGVRTLSLDGIRPQDWTALASGRYPLYRVYNRTTWNGAAAKPLAQELVYYLQKKVDQLDGSFAMVPVSQLRRSGWKFKDDELLGEPNLAPVVNELD